MGYVEGESLEDRLAREGPLPLADALRIAAEVGDALQYAHEVGVLHRDVKPANILLSRAHAMVADFGIAKLMEQVKGGQSSLTGAGLTPGTAEYMSPEQAGGAERLDARSDVYALAAVLYEMLVGEPPFTGPSVQAIVARGLTERPRPPRTRPPPVPPHVAHANASRLAQGPAARALASDRRLLGRSGGVLRVAPARRPAADRGRVGGRGAWPGGPALPVG